MTRLGYQIPNFTYPDVGPDALFDAVAAQAQAAEASGFDTVMVMDHFYQLPGIGAPDSYMLEAYTLLAGLAGRTSSVRLSTLVTGNTYRNPGLLAKIVTTLDIVSGGRAQLALGAGWFELEHEAFGYPFGTFSERFEKLDEALEIIVPMLRGDRPSLAGKHYQVVEAVNEPPPIGPIPLMIGGNGEKKTLRMAAQYADFANLTCEAPEVPRKVEVLAEHCERIGRDRSEITLSWLRRALIAPTMEEALADLAAFLAAKGLDLSSMSEEEASGFTDRFMLGDPDTVGEKIQDALALGVEGITFNAVANGHNPERVALLGETAVRAMKP